MTRGEWIGVFDIYMMIFWSVAYIECIRIGFKQRTYCMPLLALCMNFCWETLSFVDFITHNGENVFTLLIYGAWMFLDLGIIATFILYHKEEAQKMTQGFTRTVTERYGGEVFALVAGVILVMYFLIPTWKGYFVFPNNLIMSALFILMLYQRKGARGQSISIAITKCIGTLCATMTVLLSCSYDLAIMGFACFLLDVVYIVMLQKTIIIEGTKA